MKTEIYVSTFKKYNNGDLSGEWLTIQDYSDAEALEQAMIESHQDEESPEFMIQDKSGDLCDIIDESGNDWDTIFETLEAADNSHLDIDVIEAYHKNIGGTLDASIISNAEEAYSGSFDSDEDFAEDFAEQLGCIDRKAVWPQTCIDWEVAARELMYDYFEMDGHYFRNL